MSVGGLSLSLRGFRSHLESHFELPSNHSVILAGASGAGKTTLFQSVAWVLYGGMQHVYNHSEPQTKCKVTLTLHEFGITVTREKRPERLLLRYQDQEYEDDVAQQIIQKFFGSKEVWLACCYLMQNGRNLLLTSSNSEKMKIIHHLSFNDEDPEVYIEKIQGHLKGLQQSLQVKSAVYKSALEQHQLREQRLNLDPRYYLPPNHPDRQEVAPRIAEIKHLLQELQQAEREQLRIQGQLTLIAQNQAQIGPLSTSSEELLGKQEREQQELARLQLLLQELPLHQQVQRLQSQLQGETRSLSPWTPQDLTRVLEQEQRRNTESKLCEHLGVEYTPEALQLALEVRSKQLGGIEPVTVTPLELARETQYEERRKEMEVRFQQENLPYEPEALEKERQRLQTLLIESEKYTPEYLRQLQRQQDERNRGLEITQRYQLPYQQVALEQTLLGLTLLWELRIPRQLLAQLKALPVIATSEVELEAELQVVREKISRVQLSRQLLYCPHCKGKVRLTNNELEPFAYDLLSPRTLESLQQREQQLLAQLQHSRQIAQQRHHYQTQLETFWRQQASSQIRSTFSDLDTLITQLPSYPELPSDEGIRSLQGLQVIPELPEPLEQVKQQVTQRELLLAQWQRLQSLQYMTPHQEQLQFLQSELARKFQEEPLRKACGEIKRLLDNYQPLPLTSSDDIRRSLEQQRIQGELQRLQAQLTTSFPTQSREELCSSVQQLQKQRTETQKQIQQVNSYQQLERQRQELLSQVREDCSAKLNELNSTLETCELIAKTTQHYDELLQEREQLGHTFEEIEQLQAKLLATERLKTLAVQVESTGLQVTLDIINDLIAEIAPLLFEEPITVLLSPYKPKKSSEEVKHVINISILYKGGEYDNINQLSGGEGDRISLLLTLALAKLNRFPGLFLDEALSSLDGGLRDTSVKVINRLLSYYQEANLNKTIVSVCHDSVEGYYDHKITI